MYDNKNSDMYIYIYIFMITYIECIRKESPKYYSYEYSESIVYIF